MRVVMLLTGETPFGLAWAEAARTAVEVVTVDVLPRGAPVAGPDPQVVVPRARLRPKRLTSPVTDRIVQRRLVHAVRAVQRERGPVDVLHSHFFPAGRYLLGPARRLGLPHVHTEHSTTLTPYAATHKRLTPAGRRLAGRVLGSAATVAVSDYLRECLVAAGLVSDAVVIGNPVAVDRFHPETGAGARPTGRLISVGRLEADKRPLLLLDAFVRARDRFPALTLELVGDGPLRDELRDRVRRLGLADTVSLPGRLGPDEVARRVRASTAFVTATQVETFGVAIAEAIAAGTPVAAFGVTAVPELVDHTSGRLADAAGGAEALARAIQDVVSHPHAFDRDAMAARLRRRCSPAAVGNRLAELYDEVCRGAHRVTPRPR